MSWQLLVGLSVLFYSVNGLLHRILMKDDNSDAYAQSVAFMGLVGLFAFIIVLFRGGLHASFSLNQLLLFFPMVFINAIAMIFAFKGIKLIEASEHTILLTSSKLWLIIGAILFLHESFSLQKLIGAIAILLGVAVAEWRKKKFVFNQGAFYVLLAAMFYATSEIICYFILRNFEATSLIVYSCFVSVATLVIIRPGTIKKLSFYLKPKHAINIMVVSINDTIATLFVFLAYQVGRNALQIGPLMATQTIVTVLLALIILKEKDYMFQKIVGAVTVVMGTILLL